MRYSSLQNGLLISLLVVGAAAAGCSSGSDSPTPSAGGSGGTTSSGGAGGATGGTTSSGGTGGSTGGTDSGGTGGTTGSGGAGGTGGSSGSAGSSGTGGAGGTDGGTEPPSVCDGSGTRPLALGDAKVDNFEGAAISPGWSSFNDVMPMNAFKIAQVAGGAIGTANSGRYTGTGAKTTAKGGFGVGTIYNNAIDVTAGTYCVDITAFDGVTFWAKPGTVGSKVNVNFVLPNTNAKATDPTLGGGDCTAACYNHPYKTVALDSADWKQYSVTFAEAGGGSAKVKNVIQELGWLSPDADWDFSLDEIQFYKGTPPTGPTGARADK